MANVEIVATTGCSIRRGDEMLKKLGVHVVPLDVTLFDNGFPETYSDDEIKPSEFYRRMARSKQLPQTSGAINARIEDLYRDLAQKTDSIVSIHISSKLSGVYDFACTSAKNVMEEKPGLEIKVIDSKNISLGTFCAVETAAELASQGATLQEVENETLEVIPKIVFCAALATLKNVIKGGRISAAEGLAGYILDIKPVLGTKNGEVIVLSKCRGFNKAVSRMIDMVELEKDNIARLRVIHTNAPDKAEDMKNAMAQFYNGDIFVREAGSVLGAHGGENALGFALQKIV